MAQQSKLNDATKTVRELTCHSFIHSNKKYANRTTWTHFNQDKWCIKDFFKLLFSPIIGRLVCWMKTNT